MKKTLFLFTLCLALFSCSNDEPAKFNYDIKLLIGTWRVIKFGDINVTTYPGSAAFDPTYATFYSDGTYAGRGEFGNGSGTYTAVGNTITTYVNKQQYLKYDVIKLSKDTCDLTMSDSSGSVNIRCKKE